MSDSGWQVFDINEIRKALSGDKVQYREFLRVPSLSCGVYHLPKGAKDMQTPHDEDEVYFVLEGKATMKVADEMKTGVLRRHPLCESDRRPLVFRDRGGYDPARLLCVGSHLKV